MKVSELIAELQKYPQDAMALVTWEKTVHHISADGIYVSKDGMLLIDGDRNLYKDVFVGNGVEAEAFIEDFMYEQPD